MNVTYIRGYRIEHKERLSTASIRGLESLSDAALETREHWGQQAYVWRLNQGWANGVYHEGKR